MISKQTAFAIVATYQEIENGEQLIADLEELKKKYEPMNLRDVFGRPAGLELGVPCGQGSHRLIGVAPSLGVAVIRAHVAQKQSELIALNESAKSELTQQP